MSIILKTTNLCKSFNGQTAVNNISLNIERNSVYGLLGPNGAGKSTTLKMITGILRPTSGSIEFDGHAWKRSDLNHIGALIEMPPLYENLTAYENLKVRTTILGLTDKRIDEVLQIVRLTETGKKRAGQFSLGMKQRLGIAVALLNNPKLLILDEPTNGLDPIGIEELRELIRSFPAKGITVILSSHILSEVQQTADHIGIIAGGVLGYEGKRKFGTAFYGRCKKQSQGGLRHGLSKIRTFEIQEDNIEQTDFHCSANYGYFCMAYGWIYGVSVHDALLVVCVPASGSNRNFVFFVTQKRRKRREILFSIFYACKSFEI